MDVIAVGDLTSGSVSDLSAPQVTEVGTVELSSEGTALRIHRAHDVAYVPSALLPGQSLQIVGGRMLPLEAVFDAFTVEFVKRELASHGVSEVAGFAASEARDVCILGNVFSRNFTHWHEELMKVLVLERAELGCSYVLSGLPLFARELLLLFGVSESRLLECDRPTIFDSALFTTPVSYRNLSEYPEVLQALREAYLAVDVSGHSSPGPRLWLDRGAQTRLGRKLVNPEEVSACLDRYGFQPVDMGAMPMRKQIAVARSMEVLAGLHGSQFVHSQLMRPGSFVIECFSPLYLNPTYTEIYRILRHRYAQITSTNTPVFPYPHGGDVLVDIQQLELALQRLD